MESKIDNILTVILFLLLTFIFFDAVLVRMSWNAGKALARLKMFFSRSCDNCGSKPAKLSHYDPNSFDFFDSEVHLCDKCRGGNDE